jgi:hypothetical protein
MKDLKLTKARVIKDRVAGKSVRQIAKDHNIAHGTAFKMISSDECKAAIERAKNKVTQMSDLALDVVREALLLKDKPDDMHKNMLTALKAAIPILESLGAINKNLNVNVEFPKPRIIRRHNGEIIEIGVNQAKVIEHDIGTDNKE